MPVPQRVDVQHYRGDSLGIQVTIWQDAAKTVPADFTGATVTAHVRPSIESADIAAEFEVGVAGNVLTLTLEPKDTRELGPSNVFDVEVDWESDDTSVSTVVAGSLAVAPDVTRALTP